MGSEGFPEEVLFCFLDENIPYAKAWEYYGRGLERCVMMSSTHDGQVWI